MSETKFKVAICGGGVGGLTLAVALSKYRDIEIEVFEACKQFTETGAGVGMFPRTFKVFQKIDTSIAHALMESATDYEYTEAFVPTMRIRKSDQAEGIELCQVMTKGDMMRLHRADFHGILLSHLSPSCKTHTSKRLISYSRPAGVSVDSPITLNFADGSSSTCDILIGADGVKSVVRGCMMREIAQVSSGEAALFALSCGDAIFSGVIAYRTLIDAENLRACAPHHRALHEPMWYLGKDVCFLCYPVSQGKFINFVGFTISEELVRTAYEADTSGRKQFEGPWVRDLPKEEFHGLFGGLEEDTQPILKCIENGRLWAVHTTKYLPSYYHGRVAVIGDAAHAMMPFQGSGAGQGVEDAYLLATMLGHPLTTLETVPRVMAVFDKFRRPFSHDIALRARFTAQMAAWQVGDIPLQEFGARMTSNWEWAWLTDMEDMLHDAVKMLESEQV